MQHSYIIIDHIYDTLFVNYFAFDKPHLNHYKKFASINIHIRIHNTSDINFHVLHYINIESSLSQVSQSYS